MAESTLAQQPLGGAAFETAPRATSARALHACQQQREPGLLYLSFIRA
jgi:hypothetical protein